MSDKFNSVWDVIEDTPQQAASMKIRSHLMIVLQEHLRSRGLIQVEAAKLLGVTQPRVSDLMRGRIDLFSMESLVDMITNVGLEVEMKIKDAA